ncbi:MAG: SRPBCC domain-containing protein [Pseudomonadota bacterium]
MTTDPIVKTVQVPLSPEAAFELFTARIGEWWPLHQKSVSAGQGARSQSLEIEPAVGGAFVETGHDGGRHLWGTVQEWRPGEAFTTTWHPGKMADHQTRIRVTFEAEGDGTLVTLTHSGWGALSDAEAAMREPYVTGWDTVLDLYVAA